MTTPPTTKSGVLPSSRTSTCRSLLMVWIFLISVTSCGCSSGMRAARPGLADRSMAVKRPPKASW